MSLASELQGIFEVRDYKWRINGHLVVPSEHDIDKTLAEMSARLQDPDVGSIEVGRLRMQKAGDKVEVYVWMDDYDPSS